jgi:hypothetical protein
MDQVSILTAITASMTRTAVPIVKAREVAKPHNGFTLLQRLVLGAGRAPGQSFSTHDVCINRRPDQDSQLKGWDRSFGDEIFLDAKYRDVLSNDNGKGRIFKVTLAKQFGW